MSAAAAIVSFAACPAFAADGTIAPLIAADDDVGGVARDDDGKIVVAGAAHASDNESHFFVARFDSGGTLDPTFDGDSGTGNGIVETRNIPGSNSRASAMVIQADDKIVVAGTTESPTNDTDFALARYLPNGKLDTSFGGGDGIVTTDFDNFVDLGLAVGLASGGGIIVGGWSDVDSVGNHHFALARYTAAGVLDPGFDGDGRVTTVVSAVGFVDQISALAIKSGQVVAAGESTDGSNIDFTLARYSDSTGALDTSFDGDGGSGNGVVKVPVSASTFPDHARAVVIQGDNKIVVAGDAFTGNPTNTFFDFGLARLNGADGTLDTSFDGDAGNPGGGNGKVIVPVGPDSSLDQAYAIAIDGLNSKIVVAGEADPDGDGDLNGDFAVARVSLSTGVLDTSFGGDGKVLTSFGPFHDQIRGIDLNSGTGAIIAAGRVEPSNEEGRIGIARYLPGDGSLDASLDGDVTPPTTTILMGPAAGSTTLDRTPTFSFSANEFVNRFQCKVDSGAFAACSSPRTTATLADGTHTFQVRGIDPFDNVGPAASRSFRVTHSAAGGGGGGASDTSVDLRVAARKTQRAGRLKLTIRCPLEACKVTLSGSAKAGKTFKLKRRTISLKANQRKSVRLRLSRKSLGRLRKALKRRSVRRRARARITVTARDAAGNKKTKKLKLKLRR
ncbi:MAG TPA: hypothetical protein VGF21_09745 [Thermoleophilaceae bacterium]